MPQKQTLTQLKWIDYHQSSRRIAAKYNLHHGNYKLHSHDFIEIAVIVSGSCIHHSILGDSRLSAGDVILLRPGAWHGYAESCQLSLYNCCFDTALLGRELSWTADDNFISCLLWPTSSPTKQKGMVCLHLQDKELAQCRKYLDTLCSFAKKDYFHFYGDHLALLIQILSLLARNVNVKSKARPAKSHRAVAAAIKLIDDSPTEPWTLKRLASYTHVESTYFVHLFHAVLGLTPIAYVNRRRLEIAASLLRCEDIPIGEVGAKSGWLDSNYFSRCFHRHFDMTPSRYRARFKHMTNEK